MPPTSKQTIDTRVSDSFVNSNDLLSDKVNNDIDYFSSKVGLEDQDEVETTYTTQT